VILCVAGVMLALRSALMLAGRGRPRRGPRPQFVIAGPYTRLRNPLLEQQKSGLELGIRFEPALHRPSKHQLREREQVHAAHRLAANGRRL